MVRTTYVDHLIGILTSEVKTWLFTMQEYNNISIWSNGGDIFITLFFYPFISFSLSWVFNILFWKHTPDSFHNDVIHPLCYTIVLWGLGNSLLMSNIMSLAILFKRSNILNTIICVHTLQSFSCFSFHHSMKVFKGIQNLILSFQSICLHFSKASSIEVTK